MDIKKINDLAWQLALGEEKDKTKAFKFIWQLALEKGLIPSSINDFYLARGKEKIALNFTVPAMNLRGMAFDVAKAVFRVAKKLKTGALIFELARSEMGYTHQSPQEYAGVILAAGLAENFTGPVFIQGDHFQVKPGDKPGKAKAGEIKTIKQLIKDSIEAGFYNIDLDISTLVDYSEEKIYDQQKNNFLLAAQLTEYIRKIEPRGITVSLGGEIGHIGGKNSTEEELRAYMKGYQKALPPDMVGLSKMAIQTGTHHGGVPLPDGTLAEVDVDFATLKNLSKVSREYGLAGTVQHGASTLPEKYFPQFTQAEAIEVHLATEFQNIIMDHPKFPKTLLKKMHGWMEKELASERKPDWSDEQFYYKLRKKAWGPFKKQCWLLSDNIKNPIIKELEKKFTFMFKNLNVVNTQALVLQWVKPVKITK
jgi:fructose/tagatose bisphosphate aldolase